MVTSDFDPVRHAAGASQRASRGQSRRFDELAAKDVVAALLDAEARVLPAVRAAGEDVARGADLLADRWRAGGRWIFVGAGTSGRIAWSQAAELPGTFGLPRERVVARIAGGLEATDDDEDDLASAASDVAALAFARTDVLVAVAASGSTPYTLAVASAARAAGAAVIAAVTVRDSPLAALADIAIETVVGAEALRGSSRLGAGTAQKLTLDALTTAAGARIGRVHGELMIDVVGANAKLRDRSAAIVAEIAECDIVDARDALARCDGSARAAVLVLVRGLDPAQAAALAARHETLRAALSAE